MGDIATVGLNETDRTKQNFAIRQHAQRILSAESSITVLRAERRPSLFDYITDQSVISDIRNRVVADHGAVVQAALTARGGGTIFHDDGYVYSATTLSPPNGQTIQGGGKSLNGNFGAFFGFIVPKTDAPLIRFRALGAGGIKGCGLAPGASDDTTTSQSAIEIDGLTGECDSIEIEDNFIVGGYKQLKFLGVSFYNKVNRNIFTAGYRRAISVEGTIVGAGVDFAMHQNHFRGGQSSMDRILSYTGLGSAVASDNVITVNNVTDCLVCYDTPATQFGLHQSSNEVYEPGSSMSTSIPALRIGTSTARWAHLLFSNLDLAGPAELVNCEGLRLSGASSSASANGNIHIPAGGSATNADIDLYFDSGSGAVPVQCGAGAVVSMRLRPMWSGSASLVDLTATTAANIPFFDAIGGNQGSNAIPVRLPAGTIKGYRTYGP